jgi:hypothetical protein
MGYPFCFCSAGGVDAVESEFDHGRTTSLCGAPVRFLGLELDNQGLDLVRQLVGVHFGEGYLLLSLHFDQSISLVRIIAGDFGFFTFTQCGDLPTTTN